MCDCWNCVCGCEASACNCQFPYCRPTHHKFNPEQDRSILGAQNTGGGGGGGGGGATMAWSELKWAYLQHGLCQECDHWLQKSQAGEDPNCVCMISHSCLEVDRETKISWYSWIKNYMYDRKSNSLITMQPFIVLKPMDSFGTWRKLFFCLLLLLC